ncbi:MAG: hypothetical protein JSR46_09195 [Verrucomicrobia bacterium]|nr:hypothetical protein [Verrucomicrobiota bacterium]
MKENIFWILVVVVIYFFNLFDHDRYQATSVDNRAFILDKKTGEAWISVQASNKFTVTEITMAPIPYGRIQLPAEDGYYYLPEEVRNDKQSEWNTWLKRRTPYFKDREFR